LNDLIGYSFSALTANLFLRAFPLTSPQPLSRELPLGHKYAFIFVKKEVMSISQRENYIDKFKDKRLDKRANLLSASFYHGRTSSIHGVTFSEAEQKGAYRFL